MRRITITLAALTFTLAFTLTASAQNRRGAPVEPDVAYEFDDHDVEGGYRSPLGESLTVRRRAGRVSLVRPRVHFVPELLKSVERI